MSLIVIRLHPLEPTDGLTFRNDLEGLEIQVAERSFADPKGTVNVLGTARYIAEGDPNATIIQHWNPFPIPHRRPAATALVEVADPFPFVEYRLLDVVLTITRTVPPNPPQTIAHREINFNVELAPGPLPPADPFVYESITPTSLYLGVPKRLVGLGPGVAHLEVPTDGTPPPFQAVLNAMNTVLAADPNAPVDLTTLTVEQCRHIAREIVSNRTLSPLPAPPMTLDDLYTGGYETERKQFESDLLTYYTVHNTRAEVLTKFIYSVAAALACEKLTEDATQVGFTFPILPGLAPQGGKIPEATVVITQ